MDVSLLLYQLFFFSFFFWLLRCILAAQELIACLIACRSALQVVCSRMRYMSSQLPQPVRLVGLSHSLANARDVGEWLGAAGTSTFNFPPGVRPVPLEIHMHGLDIHNFEARMQVG
jgi:hypothetical protein